MEERLNTCLEWVFGREEGQKDSNLVYLTDIKTINIRNASDRTINIYTFKYKLYNMDYYGQNYISQSQGHNTIKAIPIAPGSCWIGRTFKVRQRLGGGFLTLSTAKEGEMSWNGSWIPSTSSSFLPPNPVVGEMSAVDGRFVPNETFLSECKDKYETFFKGLSFQCSLQDRTEDSTAWGIVLELFIQ